MFWENDTRKSNCVLIILSVILFSLSQKVRREHYDMRLDTFVGRLLRTLNTLLNIPFESWDYCPAWRCYVMIIQLNITMIQQSPCWIDIINLSWRTLACERHSAPVFYEGRKRWEDTLHRLSPQKPTLDVKMLCDFANYTALPGSQCRYLVAMNENMLGLARSDRLKKIYQYKFSHNSTTNENKSV